MKPSRGSKPKPKATTRSRVARLRKPDFVPYCDPEHGPAPKGEGWVREVKWDGYRAQVHLDDGRVTIYTRNGNDWSTKFWPIAEAASQLGVEEAIIDGEVVALAENGVSDFHELRRQLGEAKPRIFFQAFDLL